jgi:isopenicillin-N epimerase
LWAGVTERTRVIYISHITSPTALIFPVAEICRRARAAGILTVIDGAHAPGHIPLNMLAIGADFYTGNCHKWLCAPKGAAFLYARPEHHAMLDAHTISWGYSEDTFFLEFAASSLLIRRHQYQGTRDLAAYLSVPAAIDFQRKFNWDAVREECHLLAQETQMRIAELTGLAPIVEPANFGQMVACALPRIDPAELKRRLYDEYRVEVPIITFEDAHYVRVAFQGYNTRADADALLSALQKLL